MHQRSDQRKIKLKEEMFPGLENTSPLYAKELSSKTGAHQFLPNTGAQLTSRVF